MRGVCPHTERRPPKTRTEIQEMRFPWLRSQRRDRIPTLDPEHRQIIRNSDVVFNDSAKQKTTERPIEVRRVIFSEVTTLHEGPAHNTRSVSWVTKHSHTESTDSTQPNGSALDHPTLTPSATSPTIAL